MYGTRRKRTDWRRVILVAAAIALAAALVGCGIVYVMKMQDLKLGDRQVNRDQWDKEKHTLVEVTMPQQVLTLSGLKGSPNHINGSDVFEDMTIISLRRRGFGGSYTSPDAQGQLDFADYRNGKYPALVLKDGTAIRLRGDLVASDPEWDGKLLPLDEIDYLELIDGTRLTPVN